MEPGVRIEVTSFDEDGIDLRVEVSKGCFAAVAERIYETRTRPAELAAEIEGFPSSIADRRDVALGTLDPAGAGGGLRMQFRCVDLWGHAEVRLQVQNATDRGERESATSLLPVEPAAIDAFVAGLRHMRLELGSHAQLRGGR